MNTPNSVCIVIPARSGSKRIPFKNFKRLGSESLVEITIRQAIESNVGSRIFVSTDRPELLLETSEKLNRPQQLIVHQRSTQASNDEASALDVVKDLASAIDQESSILIYLQPTSPFRTQEDIRQALELYKSLKFDTVVSVVPQPTNLYYSLSADADGGGRFLFPEKLKTRSQLLPKLYSLNGAIYISSLKHVLRNDGFLSGKMGLYIMPENRSLDIDDEKDWSIAESRIHGGIK